jgi:hypothetical protein
MYDLSLSLIPMIVKRGVRFIVAATFRTIAMFAIVKAPTPRFPDPAECQRRPILISLVVIPRPSDFSWFTTPHDRLTLYR